jgi:hypothetical protein
VWRPTGVCMTSTSVRRERHRRYLAATIDDAGRVSLGRVDRLLGPGLQMAAAIATPHRLVIRFLDDPVVPELWVPVPVRRPAGRYPYLSLSGPALRELLTRAHVEYPVRVVFTVSLDGRTVSVRAMR